VKEAMSGGGEAEKEEEERKEERRRGGGGEEERRRRRRRNSHLEKQVKILVPLVSNFCKRFIGNCLHLS